MALPRPQCVYPPVRPSHGVVTLAPGLRCACSAHIHRTSPWTRKEPCKKGFWAFMPKSPEHCSPACSCSLLYLLLLCFPKQKHGSALPQSPLTWPAQLLHTFLGIFIEIHLAILGAFSATLSLLWELGIWCPKQFWFFVFCFSDCDCFLLFLGSSFMV